MYLIGLHGLPGAGKDTAADAIERWCEARGVSSCRQGFAYRAKWAFARQFFPDIGMMDAVRWVDDIKRDAFVEVKSPRGHDAPPTKLRDAFRWFCTEGHRDLDFMGGENHWVNALLPVPHAVHDDASRHPITDAWWHNFGCAAICPVIDVRFVNEAQRIRDLGGVIWEVVRDDVTEGSDHRSDHRLPQELIDRTFENNESIERFQIDINSEMTAEYHMKFVRWDEPSLS